MLEDIKVSAMLPSSWKKPFNIGIVISLKMRRCIECKGEILCDACQNQITESKKFEGKLYLLKRDFPNEFGHMLPYYKL